MVATHLLLQQKAEALERLRETLGALDGADSRRVREISERARFGHAGPDYQVALFVQEIAQVLADQQRRLEALESRSTSARSRTTGGKTKK